MSWLSSEFVQICQSTHETSGILHGPQFENHCLSVNLFSSKSSEAGSIWGRNATDENVIEELRKLKKMWRIEEIKENMITVSLLKKS